MPYTPARSFECCHSALSSVRMLTSCRRASSRQADRYSSQKLSGYCERGLTPSDSSGRANRQQPGLVAVAESVRESLDLVGGKLKLEARHFG